MTIRLHKGDLPDGMDFGAAVAIDTETLGLNLQRDRSEERRVGKEC